MGINGNKNRVVVEGTEKTASLECEVGLGLRTESFPSKSTMLMPHLPPPPPPYLRPCSETSMGFVAGSSGGCGTSFSNQVGRFSNIYDVVGAGSVSGGSVAVPGRRATAPFLSDSSFKSSSGGGDGGMQVEASVKAVFTASQWQELERQTLIYKYLMASMPVPPELLIPICKTAPPSPASQSNMSGGVDLRFSRSSDPEPWRCKRTDGKKWRCSRDVAPHQKYCERHAHKSRSRSRKHVESSHHHASATATATAAAAAAKIANANLNTHPLHVPVNSAAQGFQNPIFHLPTMASSTTCAQPRCSEWVIKGDPIPGSTLDQQWQQLMQSSSRMKMYNKDLFIFQPQYGEEQEPLSTNSYINDMDDGQGLNNQPANDQFCSLLGPEMLQGGANGDESQRTRRFIDAWSLGERSGEEMDQISTNCSVSSSRRLPLSSLSLSMSGAGRIDEETAHAQPMINPERERGSFKSQWPNPVSWMSSPPGGPLGEALCLGIVSNAKAGPDAAPSPRGCSNSTTTSNCSKSSCEDSSHFH